MGAGSIGQVPAAAGAPHDDERAAAVRAAARHAGARRAARALHELALRRAGDRVYVPADRDDLAAFVRQLPPDEPLTVHRARQQPAGARRRRARHGRDPARRARRARASRDGLIYAEAGVASPKVARFAAMHGLRRRRIPGRDPGHRRRRAGDERRLLRRRDVALRRCASKSLTRDGRFERATPADVRDRLSDACAAPTAARPTASSPRRGSRFRRATRRVARERIKELLRAAHRDAAAQSAERRAACSAIRRAITRRG